MAEKAQFHESFSHAPEVRAGSERAFGLVFCVVFLIIGVWPLPGDGPVRLWALGIAGAFLAAAFIFPGVLRPLNLLWFKFGLLLHKIVNPLVMALLFFVTITPMALVFRLIGKDPLNRTLDPDAETYWIRRDPPGPEPESMKNQF